MKTNASQYRMLLVCTIGCALETYDFMIYALMAPYTSAIFFPNESDVSGLLLTFATFGIGYLSRPFGAALFGHIGDRHGRKKPFSVTILLMAASTAFIGLLPGYSTLGAAAPLLLLGLRLLQGVSMGGEVGGALTYTQEILPTRKAFASCTVVCGMIFGLALGHLIHALLKALMSPETMVEMGWRIAFMIGGGLGIIGYLIRTHFRETAGFLAIQKNKSVHAVPLMHLIANHPKAVVTGMLSTMAHGFTSIYLLVFLPIWLGRQFPTNDEFITLLSSATCVVAALLSLFFGFMADKWCGRLSFMSYLAIICISLPMTQFILSDMSRLPQLALVASSILVAMMCAGSMWIFSQQFTTDIRYTGSGVSYNIGFALSGGMTPLLATYIAEKTATNYGTGYVLVFAGLCGFIAMIFNHQQNCRKPPEQGFQSGKDDPGRQHVQSQ
ncbi:MFS transporter [Parendozoicomonas sp. Alg238-R29]|uniref:MFS transporter n=1 Tax=Parendozoicomonas sp. Alg238-R29 TaxID=2993446 RepID=UPI00248DC5ED|nr:MFS transporter [Parendozoicomonas sp. Alg238-R29]